MADPPTPRSMGASPSAPGPASPRIDPPDGVPKTATTPGAEEEDLAGRVRAHLAAKDPGAIYRDGSLLLGLARMERTEPGRFAAIKMILNAHKAFRQKDFSAALKSLRREDDPEGQAAGTPGGYEIHQGCLCQRVCSESAVPAFRPLANFAIRIVEETIRDDGSERLARYKIEGSLDDGTPISANVDAREFAAMDWIHLLGARANPAPGRGSKDHLRSAIQSVSGEIPRRVTYAHTGFRTIDGREVYLHAGGAIGEAGMDAGAGVSAEGKLAWYRLPDPPDPAALPAQIRSVLKFRGLAQAHRRHAEATAAVGLALPWRVALGDFEFGVWLEGRSGAWKTEYAVILQRFFGLGFGRRQIPGTFHSTENSLRLFASLAKDAIFLIDDYRPPDGHSHEAARYATKADSVLRDIVNRQPRDGLKSSGLEMRAARLPHCLPLVTGESLTRDQSILARMMVLKLVREEPEKGIVGTLDPAVLCELSEDSRAGLHASVMSAYLQWLAPRRRQVLAGVRERIEDVRRKLIKECRHPRTPEIVGELAIGLEEFCRFAVEAGAIDPAESEEIRRDAWGGLVQAASSQNEHQEDCDPVGQFFELLAASMASGEAFLADPTGAQPEGIEAACGWRMLEPTLGIEGPRQGWREGQKKIGWVDRSRQAAYLISGGAFGAAQDYARRQGHALPFDDKTLGRRLRDRELLTEKGNDRPTVLKMLEGTKKRVLAVPLHLLIPPDGFAGEREGADGREMKAVTL